MDSNLREAIARSLYEHEVGDDRAIALPWNDAYQKPWLADADAALAAIEASGTHVVVPVEPTNEMIGAVARIPQPYHSTTTWHGDDIYRTFLRARPAAERSADDAAG